MGWNLCEGRELFGRWVPKAFELWMDKSDECRIYWCATAIVSYDPRGIERMKELAIRWNLNGENSIYLEERAVAAVSIAQDFLFNVE